MHSFVWHELCDGYLEMIKPRLGPRGNDASGRRRAAVLDRCLARSLALLHPFMPFVTEEIWEKLTTRQGRDTDRDAVSDRGPRGGATCGPRRPSARCARS